MKEIKFRAWNKEKQIMVYADEDSSSDYWDGQTGSEIELVNWILSGWGKNSKGDSYSKYLWMQYTGLKDKNGVDIYEGDLLSNGMGVVFSKYAFVPAYDWGRSDDFEDWGTDWNEKITVIGNIYENPELLTNK